jgi:hypothetical protein
MIKTNFFCLPVMRRYLPRLYFIPRASFKNKFGTDIGTFLLDCIFWAAVSTSGFKLQHCSLVFAYLQAGASPVALPVRQITQPAVLQALHLRQAAKIVPVQTFSLHT